jgi:4-amino-4-deoxy-L-arabinose transferase-like glycosyltransferase
VVNAGNIEKGRLIEIEAIYVSLTALAFIFWIAAYRAEETGKRLWLLPAIFLGLAMLAKGPLPHCSSFTGRGRVALERSQAALLATRDHFIALVVMFGMFAAWALPAFLLSDSARVAPSGRGNTPAAFLAVDSNFFLDHEHSTRSLYFLPWLPLAFLQFDEPRNYAAAILPFCSASLSHLCWSNVIPGPCPVMPCLRSVQRHGGSANY